MILKNNLKDIRLYIPDVDIHLVFATPDNILGEVLYARAVPLLQKETIKKLKEAAEMFAQDGYTIRIYDAYRPLSVQKKLFDMVQNAKYIANPETANASNHNHGSAVDISLIDADGNELDFPCPVHTLNESANRDNPDWTDEQKANVEYLTEVMQSCGFTKISSEWWHFADSNSNAYMITDIDFSSLTMLPRSAFDLE